MIRNTCVQSHHLLKAVKRATEYTQRLKHAKYTIFWTMHPLLLSLSYTSLHCCCWAGAAMTYILSGKCLSARLLGNVSLLARLLPT